MGQPEGLNTGAQRPEARSLARPLRSNRSEWGILVQDLRTPVSCELGRLGMHWNELSFEQQCVVACAMEECDLRSLLNTWEPSWTEPQLPATISDLQSAVLSLVDAGVVEAYLSGTEPSDPPLTRQEVESLIANQTSWWNGDEGPYPVVWLALTDRGMAMLPEIREGELHAYMNRPRS